VHLAKPLIILVDYRGAFNWKASNSRNFGSLDMNKLKRAFAAQKCEVELRTFPSLDFRNEDFQGRWVLLTSSEDPNLFYKSYIEDVALALKMQDAKIIPKFEQLRAHHNKAFSELMRDVLGGAALHSIKSRVFGTYEDFARENLEYPRVFKVSDGCGSRGVRLALNPGVGRRVGKRISQSIFLLEALKEMVKRIIRKEYVPRSLHRRKFIAQTFIKDLAGDYKILVYGEKFYCLARSNRSNDFRASGSGRFTYPESVPDGILDYASELFQKFDCPSASFDVAYDGQDYHLLEFQFVSFGTYTIENAPHYFRRTASGWAAVGGKTVVEEEFARSVVEFINLKSGAKHLDSMDFTRHPINHPVNEAKKFCLE
jgi:glutathione synthase/RimK-type ligase-like ATP-grasp enzyme